MRPRLRSLRCVQRALEQRPENRRLDVPPVPLARLAQPLQRGRAEFHRVDRPPINRLEQVAVEVGDLVGSGEPARGHLGEQAAYRPVKGRRISVVLRHDAREQPLRQQARVLRVQAEHQLVQVARQPLGPRIGVRDDVVATGPFHVHHDGLEHRRRLPRHRVHGAQPLAEPVRREEHVPQQLQRFRPRELADVDVVARRLHPREVGLDPYRVERRHDQQRRRLQVNLVAQQLDEGSVQLGVLALELPAEMLLEIGVGGSARHGFLEGERLRIAVGRRRRVAHQPAQVVEEGLRPLPLAEAGIPPASDKLLRRYARHHGRHGTLPAGRIARPPPLKIARRPPPRVARRLPSQGFFKVSDGGPQPCASFPRKRESRTFPLAEVSGFLLAQE